MNAKLNDRAIFMYEGKDIELNGKMRKTIEYGYSFPLDLYEEKREEIEKFIEGMTKRRGLKEPKFVVGNYCSACCSNLDDIGYIVSGSFKASRINDFSIELSDSIDNFDEVVFSCPKCATEIETDEKLLNR